MKLIALETVGSEEGPALIAEGRLYHGTIVVDFDKRDYLAIVYCDNGQWSQFPLMFFRPFGSSLAD